MLACLALALAADANKPHEHQGKFTPYTPGPPDRYGLKLSRSQAAELAKTHKPQMSVEVVEGPDVPKGTMRCTSIQDVDVPPEIVWKLLLDFPAYPKFVGGITACKPYSKRRTLTGGQVICAAYTASVTSFYKMRYFLEHVYEPFQHSMTWTLDYSRASDVHDTIGYWHVEAIETGSRVTYTQTTMLPAWIPNAIKKTFTKVAMNAAVSQLEPAALATLEKEQKAGGGARNSAARNSAARHSAARAIRQRHSSDTLPPSPLAGFGLPRVAMPRLPFGKKEPEAAEEVAAAGADDADAAAAAPATAFIAPARRQSKVIVGRAAWRGGGGAPPRLVMGRRGGRK
jgi:hypothetical protein